MDSFSESSFLRGEDIVFSSLVSLHFDEENTDIDTVRNECNNDKTLMDADMDNTFSISYINPNQSNTSTDEHTLVLSPMTSLWSCDSLNSPSSIETLRDSVKDRPFFTNTNGTMLNYTPFDNSKSTVIGDWLKTLSVKSIDHTLTSNDTFLDNSFRIDTVIDSQLNEDFVDDDDLFSLTFNPEDFSTSTNKHFEPTKHKNKLKTYESTTSELVFNDFMDANNDDGTMQENESDELHSYNHLNYNVSRMVRSSTVKSFCHPSKPEPLEISTIGVKSNNPHQVVSRVSKLGQHIPIIRKNKMHRYKGIKKLKSYITKTFKKFKNQKNDLNFFTFDETTVISRYIPELSKCPAVYNPDDTLFKDSEYCFR